MKYSIVIWDFNGTVLDDAAVSIEAINTVMASRNMKLIENKKDFQNVFCFPVEAYYKRLGFDFDKEPFSVPADEWVALYNEKKFTSPLTDGVCEVLKALKEAGVRQIVMSASEKDLLAAQLDSHGISQYFDEVIGTGDFYAKGKTELAEKWAHENNELDKKSVLFVGDTDHDYESAKIIGCDALLYSGGFMSREKLELLNVPVIDDIRGVVDIVL